MLHRPFFASLAASILVASLTPAIVGCEQVQQARETANNVASLTKAASSMEKTMTEANDRMTARRERGDTLAIPYKELQAFLPAEIAGYKAVGGPSGASTGMGGMSYSTAEQKYQLGEGDAAKTLSVTIIDYNAAGAIYTGATAMLGSGFSSEDDTQRVQTIDVGVAGIKALETWQKQGHSASLAAGVADRFLVTIEADKQDDTELVNTAIKSLDLAKMSAR